jgi:dynactin 4
VQTQVRIYEWLHPSAQLQKDEDEALDMVEFDSLKDHFEPFLRAAAVHSSSPSTFPTSHSHRNPITVAASAALSRDVPGVAKFNPLRSSRSSTGRDKGPDQEEELPPYKTRLKCSDGKGSWGGDTDVEWMKHIEAVEAVATVEQRGSSSWAMSLRTTCAVY